MVEGNEREPVKPTRFIDSVNCAIDGILWTARTQRHMRVHFIAAAALLGVMFMLRLPILEFALLSLCIAFVLFAELVNTAIEAAVDLASPQYHPLAKIAKDVAAGGVLTAVGGAAVMGYLILSRHLFPLYSRVLGMFGTIYQTGMLVSILVVVFAVIVLKAVSKTGTHLHGGLPSGHAAVAFSVATAITVSTRDPLISVLTIALAVMVSHSRLLMRIHTLKEVVFGALTGIIITLVILVAFTTLK